jgi:hypothetical protein
MLTKILNTTKYTSLSHIISFLLSHEMYFCGLDAGSLSTNRTVQTGFVTYIVTGSL